VKKVPVTDETDISKCKIKKRNGETIPFNEQKIIDAIYNAAKAVGGSDYDESKRLANVVFKYIIDEPSIKHSEPIFVEYVQDIVEKVLIKEGHAKTAKAYILYREQHRIAREMEALTRLESDQIGLDDEVSVKLVDMFKFKSKLSKFIEKGLLNDYKVLLFRLRKLQKSNELPIHEEDYLCGNELAQNIFNKKYFLKDINGDLIEKRPEDLFARIASFISAVEPTEKKQLAWAKSYYNMMYNGYFIPGGRVLAGAGDMYRLKTLSNCFVSMIEDDNIEKIYKAAYEAARTYSYGGGIGIDISVLRPKDSIVHNAADKSTGAVSFMDLYSLTTGLIGQSGRRGALMLTVDVKHPDVPSFIRVKKVPNWITNQIVEQCKWSNRFNELQLQEIQKQVMENTQIRFANISLKISDEFMSAVNEQNTYGKDSYLIYKKDKDVDNSPKIQDVNTNHYSFGMPCRPIDKYHFVEKFESYQELVNYIKKEHKYNILSEQELLDSSNRDLFGDYVFKEGDSEFAVRQAGDFMLYYYSEHTGEIKRLVKARDIWNVFVEGNYKTAEPGLIFWTRMSKYSPSNYVGRPIVSTNPCGEVPLEGGGACNLASINLSRVVVDGYTENSKIDFDLLGTIVDTVVRFLDDVIIWNEMVYALEKQSEAAKLTRRLGLGVMGIADLLNQLGKGYDSDDGIKVIEKVMSFIADRAYKASALLSEEKGSSPIFDYEKYSQCPFFKESISEETRQLIKEKGLRNIAILSIAPTGTISNIVLGFKDKQKNYIGVSGGVEPIFALYYTRRSESFGNKLFRVFHSTVQAYIDKNNLQEKVLNVKEDELKKILPEFFSRTAHMIEPEKRVKIQGLCQKYIDQSISSTVNLPEDIGPETISKIYLDAWKHGLKGLTIYREGSRYPILQAESKITDFQKFKDKKYKLTSPTGEIIEGNGDTVVTMPDGSLTTIYHLLKQQQKGEQ
jgi:ribonucleoside-diphosphate reductase alpha chain